MSERLINEINGLEAVRQDARRKQVEIVYEAFKTGEWADHPAEPQSLYSWLKLSDLSATAISQVYFVGTMLMPFCEEHNIAYQDIKTGYVIAATAVLRKYIEAEDVNQVREVLHTCRKARTRRELRDIYHQRREYWGEYYQSGTTFVIHVYDEAHAAKATQRIQRFAKAVEAGSLEDLFDEEEISVAAD